MKTSILLLVLLVIGITGAFSQSQLGRVEYQKRDRQAVVVYSQHPPEIAEGAIKDYMQQLGSKGKESNRLISLGSKGNFIAYKASGIPGYKESVDLYFRVDPKSNLEKDRSTIYLVVGTGPEEFASFTSHPELIDKAKEFMNALPPKIDAYFLEVQIKEQEALLKQLDGKLTVLNTDSTDLDKKIKGLQEKMLLNSAERLKQVEEMEKQKLVLEAMKGRRKSG